MAEAEQAIILANRVLDRVNADPDDDLAVLARQLLRAREALEWREIANYKPPENLLVIATDGKVRWMDKWSKYVDGMVAYFDYTPHRATHWHPVAPLPIVTSERVN